MANLNDLPKLKSYSISVEPLWGDDAGRESMAGQYSGTFIGYFTTITLEFGETTQVEHTKIKSIFEQPLFNFTYPSDKTGKDVTEEFYGTAITSKKSKDYGKYASFSIDIVATQRRD